MTRDDIIRMAQEAGYPDYVMGLATEAAWSQVLHFAALVAAEKEQQMIEAGWRKCAVGQRTTQFCGLLDEAVKAEREACARACEDTDIVDFEHCMVLHQDAAKTLTNAAAAIRARGEVQR